MVELISRISKGTRMDQIYIPKERLPGFELGTVVLIKPVLEKAKLKPYYYNASSLEPIKNSIIEEIISHFEQFENVIITGSFLEKGFGFEDIDVILVTDKKMETGKIEKHFKTALGLNVHMLVMGFKALLKGLSTDPLFQMMLSRFISKKRVIFKVENEAIYKLLDIHLLKSKIMIDNYDNLTGNEKYKLTRNLAAIKLFLDNEKISTEAVNNEIDSYFGEGMAKNIKENLLNKNFLNNYKKLYNEIFKKILNGIKNGSKQKQAD